MNYKKDDKRDQMHSSPQIKSNSVSTQHFRGGSRKGKGSSHKGYNQLSEGAIVPEHNFSKSQSRTYASDDGSCNMIHKTYVNKVDWNLAHPQRAGVIIYTVYDGIIYFGLGLDFETHDLTDFGGRVRFKIDKNAITGALREFSEESSGIFGTINEEDVQHCPVVYDKNLLILFIRIASLEPNKTSRTFKEHAKLSKNQEICCITWLTWGELTYVIRYQGFMFDKIQKFLHRAGNIGYLL